MTDEKSLNIVSFPEDFSYRFHYPDFVPGEQNVPVYSAEFDMQLDEDIMKWKIFFAGIESNANAYYVTLVDKKLPTTILASCDVCLLTVEEAQSEKSCSEDILSFVRGTTVAITDENHLFKRLSEDSFNTVLLFHIQIVEVITHDIAESSLIGVFSQLRMDSDFSDIKFSVRGTEFKAHKAILAARSPVFSAMFKHNMQEANSGEVEITDIEPAVFKEFLYSVYTGKAHINDVTAAGELLAVAEKYDVKDMKEFWKKFLKKNTNEENCFQILAISDVHCATSLKEKTLTFIVDNKRSINQEGLADIDDPSLLKEIIQAMMSSEDNYM